MSIYPFIMIFMNMLLALLAMAFYTLMERKLLGYIQIRKGPNKVSISGIPQPLSDAMKLFIKEPVSPSTSNASAFYISPLTTLTLILIMWALYPQTSPVMFFTMGTLLFLCLSSLNVYPTLGAGWSSNSKYALLGAIRSVAQTISYEVSMALILISVIIMFSSYDFNIMLSKQSQPLILMLIPTMVLWLITCLAETNRAPFDFVEGESELVSGFNIEYGGGGFALLFMAEYMSIIFMSVLSSLLFLSFNYSPLIMTFLFPIVISIFSIMFIWIRGGFPRMRYDRLMNFSWKSILPFSICLTLFMFSLMIFM